MSLYFCGLVSHNSLTLVALISFGFFLWKMNHIVSVTACFFQPLDRQPSSLYIDLVHTGSFILNKSLYLNVCM